MPVERLRVIERGDGDGGSLADWWRIGHALGYAVGDFFGPLDDDPADDLPVDELFSAPNCSRCLVRMVPSGEPGRERWRCSDCGLVRLP